LWGLDINVEPLYHWYVGTDASPITLTGKENVAFHPTAVCGARVVCVKNGQLPTVSFATVQTGTCDFRSI